MKQALVTGVNGFVGHHLSRFLKSQAFRVLGVGLQPKPTASVSRIIDGYFACDMTKASAVARLPIQDIDLIINLAGLAKVGDSFAAQRRYMQINVAVFAVLAKRLIEEKLPAKIIAVSSGAVYEPDQALPFSEESKLISRGSPYALSKIKMEAVAKSYIKRGLRCLIVRPFNHIGPGQEEGFLLPDLYKKIGLAQTTDGVVKVGDLSTSRDYTDVRDVVRAYVALASQEPDGNYIYNICSGKPVAGQLILDQLLDKLGLVGKLKIVQDKTLIRPNDPKIIYGDNSLIYNKTGWQPKMPLDKTIADFVKAKTSEN